MSTITTKLKEEFFALLPPTIFFFVALHIVALIHSLMLKAEGIPPLTSVSVAVAALLLGKAVLIADMLPAINRFPERPLIYNVVWKTAIYMLVSPNSKPNHQPNHHLTTKPTPNTMKKHPLIHTILPFAIGSVVGSGTVLQAAEADSRQAAIFKTANAFVEAFHKGDAKALAAFWTPEGDYVDDTGRVLQGREAIEKSYTELFAAHQGMKLRIDVASLKFPTPDTAIEDGTSVVIPPDGSAPSRARYTNMLVKTGDHWLLSSVRESADPGPSNYENLRGLEWAIGEWLDAAPAADAPAKETGHVSFAWAPGQNFIISTRTVDYKDASLLQSTQWIGWDAAAKQIRSWGFQADGGVSQSTWTQNGHEWVVKTEATLADGSKVVSTNVVKAVTPDAFTWQSKEQKLNGQPLPDTTEIKMTRAN